MASDDFNVLTSPASIAAPSGGGVTWVSASTTYLAGTTDRFVFQTWYGLAAAGGDTTVTVDVTGAGAMGAVLEEITNISSVIGQPDGAQAVSGVGDSPKPFCSTGHDVDWLYAAWAGRNYRTKVGGPTEGYSEIAFLPVGGIYGSGQKATIAAADRLQTLHGSHQPLWTVDIGGDWTAHALGLKAIGPPAAFAGTAAVEAGGVGVLTAPMGVVVPAAVVDLPERWLFRPYNAPLLDFATMSILALESSGADAHPALRGNDAPWAGRPGEQPLDKLAGSRIITLSLVVLPTTPSGGEPVFADAIATRVAVDALQAALALRTQGELIRVMPDGTGRAGRAEVVSVAEIKSQVAPFTIGLSVNFKLADPWMYASSIAVGSGAVAASPTTFTVTHPGSVFTDRMLIELIGPLTNPAVLNRRNGVRFAYAGAIATGSRLVVDVAGYQALLAGASMIGSLTHYGDAAFMRLEPGDNSIEVRSDVLNGSVLVTFNPSYV